MKENLKCRIPLYPLHIVSFEFGPLDIEVIDKQSGVAVRPWLAIGFDKFSKFIWYMNISLKENIVKSLANTMLERKNQAQNTNHHGLSSVELIGIPLIFELDREMFDKELQEIAKELNITMVFQTAASQKYGFIERYFDSVNSELTNNLSRAIQQTIE